MSLSGIERRIRHARMDFIRRMFSGPKGRRQHLSAMGDDVLRVTRDLGDHVLTFNPHDSIGKHLYSKGDWERAATEQVVKLTEAECGSLENSVIVELGANIGTQTVYLHLLNRFSHIFAVEASPDNIEILRENILQNVLQDKTTIIDVALGERDGEIELFLAKGNTGAHSVIVDRGELESIKVTAKTLKRMAEDYAIDADRLGLFWVDLEGFELEALKQIVDLYGAAVPIFTEFSPHFYGAAKTTELLTFLKAHFDDCYIFEKRREPQRCPVSKIPEDAYALDVLLLPRRSGG